MTTSHSGAAGSATREYNDELKAMKAELASLKEDVKGVASSAGGVARATLHRAREGVAHAFQATREKGAEAIDSARDHIADRPLTAVAIAAGVGFVIGMLISRRGN